ncbi:hypothetical protein Pfo_017979 [Paulownia fortunei]|nr:hypothetical protein Pfo_017979 [Paulownia fortunei]
MNRLRKNEMSRVEKLQKKIVISNSESGRLSAPSILTPASGTTTTATSVFDTIRLRMPKVRTIRTKYPDGWESIDPTLRELNAMMRQAENVPHDGKRKHEALELYEFCLEQGYADRNLIAKWKKPGYERLCCLHCIQRWDHNFATTCICRVPKQPREADVIECVHCGCRGCASGDS